MMWLKGWARILFPKDLVLPREEGGANLCAGASDGPRVWLTKCPLRLGMVNEAQRIGSSWRTTARLCNKGCHFKEDLTSRHYISATKPLSLTPAFFCTTSCLLTIPPTCPVPEISQRNKVFSIKLSLLPTSQTWVIRVYSHLTLWLELSVRGTSFWPKVLLCACFLWHVPISAKIFWDLVRKPAFLERLRGWVVQDSWFTSYYFMEVNLQGLLSRDGNVRTEFAGRPKPAELQSYLFYFETWEKSRFQIVPNSPALDDPSGRSK